MVLLTILGKHSGHLVQLPLPASKLEKISQCLINSFGSPCGWQLGPQATCTYALVVSLVKPFPWASAHDHCLLSKSMFPKPVGAGRVQVDPPVTFSPALPPVLGSPLHFMCSAGCAPCPQAHLPVPLTQLPGISRSDGT